MYYHICHSKMLLFTISLIPYLVFFVDGQAIQCGNRPTQLINIQSQCENAPDVKEGLLERVEHGARSFFKRAKEELGLKVDVKVEPKKCEYYKCIFERLGMLNQLGLPDLSLIQAWVNANVEQSNKDDLNAQIGTCFRLLATSAVNIQNDCETDSHLMMCLHSVDKCETFNYP